VTLPDPNHEITCDWVETCNQWRDVFAPLAQYRTSKRLPGVNMVTNEHLATYAFGPVIAELSTGLFPNLGERPRTEHRSFGCSVGYRGDRPMYGEWIEGTTMPEVLDRWWVAATTGLAYLAVIKPPAGRDGAEAVLRLRHSGVVLEDAINQIPRAYRQAVKDRMVEETEGTNA
jgi:hypothetical protein